MAMLVRLLGSQSCAWGGLCTWLHIGIMLSMVKDETESLGYAAVLTIIHKTGVALISSYLYAI